MKKVYFDKHHYLYQDVEGGILYNEVFKKDLDREFLKLINKTETKKKK